MLNLQTNTKLNPEEVLKRAVEFFGTAGYGLELKEQGKDCVYFEGGGGGVDIVTCAEEGGTSIEIASREWDYQAKEFLGKIR